MPADSSVWANRCRKAWAPMRGKLPLRFVARGCRRCRRSGPGHCGRARAPAERRRGGFGVLAGSGQAPERFAVQTVDSIDLREKTATVLKESLGAGGETAAQGLMRHGLASPSENASCAASRPTRWLGVKSEVNLAGQFRVNTDDE
jgi:hypothetical protein